MPPLVSLIRFVHLVIAATQLGTAVLASRGHEVVGRLLSCFEIFLYQGMVLFEQYKLLKYDKSRANEREQSAYIWILLEINTFYLYISSAIIFLLYIQCRGICGKTKKKE